MKQKQNQNETSSLAIETPMLKESATQTLISVSSPIAIDVTDLQEHSSNDEQTQKDVLMAAIADLATLMPLDYDRKRKEMAKELGVQLSTLDAEVKAARGNVVIQQSTLFPTITPHPDTVIPKELFDEIRMLMLQYIVLDQAQSYAVVLWIAMTWVIDELDVAPLAIINAPEKACGKTQLLELISRLAARPLASSNMSTAALFRVTEKYNPTLLIDEVDMFIKENQELKGLINAGHTRSSSYVIRIVGDNYEPQRFNVFGAKVLAGISLEKHLSDSTMSRGIMFNMRRKLGHEQVSRLRHADQATFDVLKSKLARFALDYAKKIRDARPALPESLSDREQDNWEGLMAIASCAGDGWSACATHASLNFAFTVEESLSIGTELLMDIQYIFEKSHVDKISTTSLIDDLITDEERPWGTHNRGKAISPRQIAQMLSAYGIQSKTVRLGNKNTPKGYDLGQFKDAFSRYLTTETKLPQQHNDTPEDLGSSVELIPENPVAVCEDF